MLRLLYFESVGNTCDFIFLLPSPSFAFQVPSLLIVEVLFDLDSGSSLCAPLCTLQILCKCLILEVYNRYVILHYIILYYVMLYIIYMLHHMFVLYYIATGFQFYIVIIHTSKHCTQTSGIPRYFCKRGTRFSCTSLPFRSVPKWD